VAIANCGSRRKAVMVNQQTRVDGGNVSFYNALFELQSPGHREQTVVIDSMPLLDCAAH